jgi:immune inhibitor A
MLIRKTVLVLVLAFALLSLGLQASVLAPAAVAGGVNLLANYSSIPLQQEAKDALLAKNSGVKTYHLPQGEFVGAKKIFRPEEFDVTPLDVTSGQKALVILFRFADEANDPVPGVTYSHFSKDYFTELLFSSEYDPYKLDLFDQYAEYTAPDGTEYAAPTDRTLLNYLRQVSNDPDFAFSGDVVEVTLQNDLTYSSYAIGGVFKGLNNANGDFTMGKILDDVVRQAVADGLDLSLYGDPGTVLDNVFFIHSGTGAEWSGTPDLIWSHSWDYGSAWCYYQYALTKDTAWLTSDDLYYEACARLTFNDVTLNDYSIEPEVGGDLTGYTGVVSGPFAPDVGVYAHEYAHVLGAPDQYDYGYESEGTGIYSLMSSGSWTRWPNAPQYSGNTPVHLDAWSKYYLGFDTMLDVIDASGEFYEGWIKPSSGSNEMVRIDVPFTKGKEFFLVENRQQIGFDKGLNRGAYGDLINGVAIYHIDDNVLVRNFSRAEEAPAMGLGLSWTMNVDKANGEWHYGISILQADNRWDLERGKAYYGWNDLYKPGMSFGPTTRPASISYYTNFKSIAKNVASNYTGIYVKVIRTDEAPPVPGALKVRIGIE